MAAGDFQALDTVLISLLERLGKGRSHVVFCTPFHSFYEAS
jgi:hypothetical protein